jgi:hypothetical protein
VGFRPSYIRQQFIGCCTAKSVFLYLEPRSRQNLTECVQGSMCAKMAMPFLRRLPCLTVTLQFALSDSDTLITEDEYWFAVDASNDDIRYSTEELATAYANFYHTAKVRSMTSVGAASEIVSSQSRARLLHPIQRGAPLYHLLSSAPGSILESVGPALYLNIILWR